MDMANEYAQSGWRAQENVFVIKESILQYYECAELEEMIYDDTFILPHMSNMFVFFF